MNSNNKNMSIMSFNNSIVDIILNGNSTFLYEHLLTENNVSLEVLEINLQTARCVIYGDASLLKINMPVFKTNKYLTIKFSQSKIGKVVNPNMEVISDNIFESPKEDTGKAKTTKSAEKSKNNEEEISLVSKSYNINDIGTRQNIIRTGIKVVDFFTPITYGSKIGILGGAGVGKAQPLDSKILTPSGYIKMSDVTEGTTILGSHGSIKVTGVFPQGKKEVYSVIFEDGRKVQCCINHIWSILNMDGTVSNHELQEIIEKKKTSEIHIPIYKCLFNQNASLNKHVIALFILNIMKLINFENGEIYVSKFIHIDLINLLYGNCEIENYSVDYFKINDNDDLESKIKDIKLEEFMYSDMETRCIIVSCMCNISTNWSNYNHPISYIVSEEGILEYKELFIHFIRSVGGIIVSDDDQNIVILNADRLAITDIQYVDLKETQCIQVDAQNGIYLTDNCIPTHNTTLMLEMISNINTGNAMKIFCGIGERIREGLENYKDFVNSKIIDILNPSKSDTLLIYGNMDQPASIRQMAGRVGVAIARHMAEVHNKDTVIIIDNIFRYNQASCEISTALDQFQTEKGYHPNIRWMMSKLQENLIPLNNGGKITSIQAIYIPADDVTDIGATTCQEHQSVSIVLNRELAKQKIYPAIDLLSSWSINMQEFIVGKKHLSIYKIAIKILNRYTSLLDLINIVGLDNLSFEDQLTVKRAKLIQSYMTQSLSVTQQFMDIENTKVDIDDVISDMENIINGLYDSHNPSSLRFKGSIKNMLQNE